MKHGSGKVNIAKTFIAKNRHFVVAFQLRPNRKSLRDPQSQSHCIFVSPMRAGQDRRRELSLQGRDPVGRKISESPRSTQAGGALTRRPPSSRLFIPLLDRAEGGREGGKCLSFAHSAVFCTSALSKRQRRRKEERGRQRCLSASEHSLAHSLFRRRQRRRLSCCCSFSPTTTTDRVSCVNTRQSQEVQNSLASKVPIPGLLDAEMFNARGGCDRH